MIHTIPDCSVYEILCLKIMLYFSICITFMQVSLLTQRECIEVCLVVVAEGSSVK